MARDEIKLMIHSLNQTSKAALRSFSVARDRLHYGHSQLQGTAALWSFSVAQDRLHCFSFTKGGALTPKHSGCTCL